MSPEEMEKYAATLAETAEAVRRMQAPTLDTLRVCAELHMAAAAYMTAATTARAHEARLSAGPSPRLQPMPIVQQRAGGKQR